jgi:SsrA-binding protein
MKQGSNELVSNRRATYDYEVLETFVCGIMLTGTEIKSLRDNGGNLQDAYVKVIRDELWLLGCSIAPYRFGNLNNHEDRRDRKLLMHKREIQKLKEAQAEKGLAVIPLAMFLEKGRAKVKIAIGKGKKSVDKRASIKDRDAKRSIEKAMKSYGQD